MTSQAPINGVKITAVDDPSRVVRVQGQDGKTSAPREIAYTNCKVVGNGSFGVVFMAKLVRSQQLTAVKSESKAQGEARSAAGETTTTTTSSSEPSAENGQQQQQAAGSSSSPSSSSSPPKSDGAPAGPIEVVEDIAIKKVLQDKRFKNRELQIMRLVSHPNVVDLRAFFYSNGDKPDEVYLNLVLEYIPETVYRASRHYAKLKQTMPMIQIKLYMYQLLRSLAYIHSVGICHRDIKPQNLLIHPTTGVLKLIDFGSAKILVPGEPNVSYICSRYYRAPELIFGATNYTAAIDVWSTGCVMAELMLGQPLFPGESGIDQLVEIIKVLGTPTREQIKTMNPNYMEHKFPQIRPHPFSKVFRPRTDANAISLVEQLLQYTPGHRLTALRAMAHPFFDELRLEGGALPSGRPFPPLFNFGPAELSPEPELVRQLVPVWMEDELRSTGIDVDNFVPVPLDELRLSLD